MGRIGHAQGPDKLELVEHHGPGYFGCIDGEHETDVHCRWLESQADIASGKISVEPVDVDEDGNAYVEWSAPGGGTQREPLNHELDPIFLADLSQPLLATDAAGEARYKARIARILREQAKT
jgi:hypothetical protein